MPQKQDHNVHSFFQNASKEDDRALALWLDAYKVEAPDAQAQEVLLDRIVAAAMATPQRKRKPFSWRGLMQGWLPDAAAFAAIALLGFWIGDTSALSGMATTPVAVAQQASSTSDTYFDRVIFGPTSWKEIIL